MIQILFKRCFSRNVAALDTEDAKHTSLNIDLNKFILLYQKTSGKLRQANNTL